MPWVTRPLGAFPNTWREQVRLRALAFRDLPRTMRQDSTSEMAAGMTFYLLFSLFPALLCLVTLLPFMPLDSPVDQLFELVWPASMKPLPSADCSMEYKVAPATLRQATSRPRLPS